MRLRIIMIALFIGITVVVKTHGCAMFTLVSGDTVLMGNNEDFIKPGYVWFVPAETGKLGRVNFGFNDHFAQGSMNEKGLAFDAAVVGEVPWEPDPAKKEVDNLLELIMDTCGTVKEALALFETYNCKHLARSQFMFADETGDGAVVTWWPETGLSVVRRSGEYLINTNTRLEASAFRCERYVLAERVVAGKTPTIDVARDALNAIHQEGKDAFTSYSNVYDLKRGLVHVYNLANYDEVVTFDLAEELAKGPHDMALKKVFKHSPSLKSIRTVPPRIYDTRIALPAENLEALTGSYSVMDGKAIMKVELAGDELLFIPPDGKAAHLFPESESKFRIVEGGQVTFTRAENGDISGFVMHRNGDHVGNKVPE